MERSIDEVARATGLTTRALRHYGEVGLLAPSSVGAGGRRRYDDAALVRLQRILLLRELGVGLADIRRLLDRDEPAAAALTRHLAALRAERERLERRIRAVETTVAALERGDPLMAEEMFDGFDHGAFRDEVEQRWGAETWATGDRWWGSLTDGERTAFRRGMRRLQDDWAEAARRGVRPGGDEAQALAARQVEWLAGIPGTPSGADYVRGLGEMYAEDERYTPQYGGAEGAGFVRDALAAWADAHP